ncbi:Na/Pi cotransporter family protein [Nisaea sediminum]|uniref:Na/Pi cotransporter family protein n=1 Tax=Nisaea sediminum TaxID=2775867 RepID=UPI0018674770|nr:Na/Pi cotransporter family protein [Nisaea sediminum]
MDLLINILGGVALLLWGVRMVRTGVTRAFGSSIRRGIAAATRNRLSSFVTGLGVTTILQSSTATALIVSSFGSRKMVGVAAGLAIMLGADVGSTIVVQVLAFDVTWMSPVLLFVGVTTFLSSENSRRKAIARVLIGLGLMLLAIKLVMLASVPLREGPTMSMLLAPLRSEPVLAIVFAALLTWMAHSSLTVIVLIMTLVSLNVVELQVAIMLVLGANIGSAITPVAMNWGGEPAARRVPLGNLFMRTVGVILVFSFIPWIVPLFSGFSVDSAHLIANVHTGFNLAVAILFLPMIGWVARLVTRILPERPGAEDLLAPRHLEEESLDTPTVALSAAARETLRMGDTVQSMLARSMEVFRGGTTEQIKEIEREDDVVDSLHEAVKIYLTKLSRQELDPAESQRVIEILSFTTNLEHIGDIIDKNLMELAAKKLKDGAVFSKDGMEELETFHAEVLANLKLALSIFMTGDQRLARRLMEQKVHIRELELKFSEAHYARIRDGKAESIGSSSLHLDVLRDLKRINSHITSVAYPILESTGQIAESRLREA